MSPKKKQDRTVRERLGVLEEKFDTEKEAQEKNWVRQEDVNKELTTKAEETKEAVDNLEASMNKRFSKSDKWQLAMTALLLVILFLSEKLYEFFSVLLRLL
ncbi:MAG: hypothetical protein KAW12_01055 [Candidatus Aminicenantes bacterium]|nr:hypothetical protein [Candidatus Aminicenantes bacterium]